MVGRQVPEWTRSRLIGTEDIEEAGESSWAIAWKAGDSFISSCAAGFFFLNSLFPASLGFFPSLQGLLRVYVLGEGMK